MTLIEAARIMLADSFLPNTFWAEAVSTTCYVLNRGKFEEKSDEGFLVGYYLNSKASKPITAENKANKTAAEYVQEYFVLPLWSFYTSTVKSSKAKNRDQKLNGDTGSKTNNEPVDQDDQAFLEELKMLKRQANEADDAGETLRKTFAQGTKDFLIQSGAARASSTNYVNTASTLVNTASTPVNIASTPVNTASPSRNVSAAGPSYPDLLTYANQDDSQIPSLEDIHEVLNERIFTSESYDAEGAVADFTNLEFTVNMDVKSALLYGKIDEEVYVSQPLGFLDPKFPKKVYKVVKALYGLHQAPKAWYATLSTFLVKNRYIRGIIDKTLFIKKDKKDIMLDKYVAEILKKFDFMSVKTAITPINTKKPLVKDAEAADVSGHSKDFTSSVVKNRKVVPIQDLRLGRVVVYCCIDSTFFTSSALRYNLCGHLATIEVENRWDGFGSKCIILGLLNRAGLVSIRDSTKLDPLQLRAFDGKPYYLLQLWFLPIKLSMSLLNMGKEAEPHKLSHVER
nr:reverse transcriptase [Tanacetum cinerariifolium]